MKLFIPDVYTEPLLTDGWTASRTTRWCSVQKNKNQRVCRSEAAPERRTRRIIPPPLAEVQLSSDATCLRRFNKDQSAQGSSTNLPNVTRCGIIAHSKWAPLPTVSLLEFLLFFFLPAVLQGSAARRRCRPSDKQLFKAAQQKRRDFGGGGQRLLVGCEPTEAGVQPSAPRHHVNVQQTSI